MEAEESEPEQVEEVEPTEAEAEPEEPALEPPIFTLEPDSDMSDVETLTEPERFNVPSELSEADKATIDFQREALLEMLESSKAQREAKNEKIETLKRSLYNRSEKHSQQAREQALLAQDLRRQFEANPDNQELKEHADAAGTIADAWADRMDPVTFNDREELDRLMYNTHNSYDNEWSNSDSEWEDVIRKD
eukprot:TRINITY_DN35477_c0_g1_i1.p1 TRINITY_DN35477_c0_g1~~TRINITY_DN35477_c0_g1_i1.p1  ORF type:complete len:210 (+),score=69.26 TRINITY_DN35477_c0_g1_i1:55-630(+)